MFRNHRITTQEAADFIGVGRACMSSWRKYGGGPAFETYRDGPAGRPRYEYRLGEVLKLMKKRGATPEDLEFVRKIHMKKLMHIAGRQRCLAATAVRKAREASQKAADAGHELSRNLLRAGKY